ncbi:hypothetical protein [Croceibacterium ferulae]|uniref:hypothetical protein n=1 Tax=Croceibacterium ferulae TaxID=1854641 RepID=UPI000EB29408|nr:hypothetical protein [Croceibacterium ferulae]
MVGKLLGIIAAASLIQTAPLRAEDATVLVLSPSANWTADFAENSCSLRRSFSGGGKQVAMEFKSFGTGGRLNVTVASDTLGRGRGELLTGFQPDREMSGRAPYRTLQGSGGWSGVAYTEDLPRNDATIEAYRIRGAFATEVELTTGPLTEMASVLRQCEDDLLTTLSLDPLRERTLSRRVELESTSALLRKTAAITRNLPKAGASYQVLRLLIDEDGRSTDCRAIDGQISAEASSRSCDLLRDIRFKPALDADNQPVPSITSFSVYADS